MQANWIRYGWIAVLLALFALWMRIENLPMSRIALAAPQAPSDEKSPLKPSTIGVVDIAVVFKHYRQFNDEMAKIKEDIEVFDKYVKEQAQELKELSDQLQKTKRDSAEHQAIEQRATTRTAELQAQVTAKKAALLEQEASVYFDAYGQVESATRTVSRQRKVDFVLRYNSEPMKREDRNSVLQGVNRAVVSYPKGNDITEDVLKILNES